jgi:hypothetical protein
MGPEDKEPTPIEAASVPAETESKKNRRSVPKKPALRPENALPPTQSIKTKTEIQPVEHADERKSRLRLAEKQKEFEILKGKAMLFTAIGLIAAIVVASLLILAFSARPELINFATTALGSCLAGLVGYVTGKSDSKKTE